MRLSHHLIYCNWRKDSPGGDVEGCYLEAPGDEGLVALLGEGRGVVGIGFEVPLKVRGIDRAGGAGA